MSANLNAAEVLQGVVSTPAALEAVLNQGAMIVNDYVITIEAVDGGYKLIARRGSDEQAMVILNGVDAPVPDIKITDVEHGHDVTITVGDVAKTFYIHDGVDAPVPEISVEAVQGGHKVITSVGETVKSFTVKDGVDGKTPVKGVDYFDGKDGYTPVNGKDYFDGKDGYTPVKGKDYFDGQPGQPGKDGISPVVKVTDIENGHRVTITTGSDVQSFDVLDGKDGKNGEDAEGGTVEVDPTLSIEGMAADAKATGDAVKPITAILDTTTNKIGWDGVIGDRLTVEGANGYAWVHVTDYAPDASALTEQGFDMVAISKIDGATISQHFSEAQAKDAFLLAGNGYAMYPYSFIVVALEDGYTFDMHGVTFPEKGVYFAYKIENASIGIKELSSPILAVLKVKEEALPESVSDRLIQPEHSPVLFSAEMRFSEGVFTATPNVMSGSLTAPIAGRRYAFGILGNPYSGIAEYGQYNYRGSTYSGIGITAEQNSDVYVFFRESGTGFQWWGFKLSEADASASNGGKVPFAVIDGDGFYNTLSAANDAISMSGVPEGVSIVRDVSKLYKDAHAFDLKSANMYEALKSDVEITFDMDGTEYTLPSSSLTFVPDTILMGFNCDLYMYGQAPLAGITHDGDSHLLALLDVQRVMGAGPITKSIKVNYPGIFAPVVPAKQIPSECLPGAFIAYVDSFVEAGAGCTSIYNATDDEYTTEIVNDAFRSGMQMYVCVRDDMNNDEMDCYPVMRVTFARENGKVKYAKLYYMYKDGKIGICGTQ